MLSLYQRLKGLVLHFRLLHIAVFFFLVCGLAGCREQSPQKPVRIGLIAYTKGETLKERLGLPTISAAELAVSNINRAGGLKIGQDRRPVNLVVAGIASSPQNAIAATRNLINRENVVAIVGPQYSADAIPAGAFAEKARLPMISPMSTNSRTTDGRQYVFRMSFIDQFQGRVMARFAIEDLGSRKAAVLYNRADPYSRGIVEVFVKEYRDLGGEVVAAPSFAGQVDDYSRYIAAIWMHKPDVLYLPGFASDVKQQVNTVEQFDFDVTLLGADGWNVGEFSKMEVFNDSYVTTHWGPGIGGKEAGRFATKYREMFDSEPQAVAALTYDSMQILFKAIERAGNLQGRAIRESLIALEGFEGVTGTIDFVDSGDPEKGVVVLRLRDGNQSFEKYVYPDTGD